MTENNDRPDVNIFIHTEADDARRQQIEELRRKVIEAKDLKTRTDDAFLLKFLSAKKFNQQKSFELLKSYYGVRKKYRNIFNNFVPSAVRSVLESGIFEVLPHPDQLGRTVLIGRAYKWDVSIYPVTELLRGILMILEASLEKESTQNNGIVLIYDSAGLTWHHCLQFTPNTLYLIQLLLEDTFPALFKEWHIVNMHVFAKGLMSLVMPIVKPKLRKRIHLYCSSKDVLNEYISRHTLPAEYGGYLQDYDITAATKRILELEDMFQMHQECWNEK